MFFSFLPVPVGRSDRRSRLAACVLCAAALAVPPAWASGKDDHDRARQAVQAGLPTAAECGGFLYLGRSLEDADGKVWPMADVLPGDGIRVGRLVRFGYAEMTAKADSMLFCAGETLPIHEFHHWDSTANGTAFTACKNEKMQWECGFANENFYAGFPHLYWAGTPLPGRFVRAAERYSKTKG